MIMSTTDGEVGEFLPWVSGTDVWYDTYTSWNGVKVGANSVLYIYGRWCFNLHITYNLNIMEPVGMHIQNIIKSCYYHYMRTLRSQGHHNCLSALMINKGIVMNPISCRKGDVIISYRNSDVIIYVTNEL